MIYTCLIPRSTPDEHKAAYITLCYVHHTHQPVIIKKKSMSWKLLFFSKSTRWGKSRFKFMTPCSSTQVFLTTLPYVVIIYATDKENNPWASEIALWTKVCLCKPGDLNSVPTEEIPDSKSCPLVFTCTLWPMCLHIHTRIAPSPAFWMHVKKLEKNSKYKSCKTCL